MREETRSKLCELLEVGENEAFKKMVFSEAEKRWSDFWVEFDNLNKLVDLEIKLDCKTETAE
jgi:hypothetical protein